MLLLLAMLATAVPEEPLRINDLQMIGTHNSYKLALTEERMALLRAKDPKAADALDYAHRPLVEQLDAGARQLEFDVYYDPKGGLYADGSADPALHQPGFKVQHVAGFDNRASCVTLVQCLTIVKDWSNAHSSHVPILLMFNTNDRSPVMTTELFTEAAYDALDAEVRSVLEPGKLITPDDVQGRYPTLREAALANNWPTLEASRGKFMFALDAGPEKVALYRGKRKSLEGRVFFVNTDEDSPAAAYITLNDPIGKGERITRDVKAGFIVRTRADDNTWAARINDTAPREASFRSGAQYVSTDYLWPDPRFPGGYHVTMPNGVAALCNPVRRPQGCGSMPLEPAAAANVSTPSDPLALVDPFIGVDWHGQTFLGATVPFGMVKVGPDMDSFDGLPSKFGYLSGGRVLGFSHLHLSGAAGKYGNVRIMPAIGEVNLADIASPVQQEVATPGYYAATLTRPRVRAEMTTSGRAGLHRYTFLSNEAAHLTVRLDQILTQSKGREGQRFLGANVSIDSPREISGMGRYAGGWNLGAEYRVYFALIADQKADGARIWNGQSFSSKRRLEVGEDAPIGATLDFAGKAGRVLNVRVGISFVSVEQARQNARRDQDFASARTEAETAWRTALSTIQVEGGRESDRRKFYTGLYHVMLMPSDRTGENPKWQSSEPYYDDYYAIWDTFRSAWPLLTLIQPERSRDLLRSLVDIYRHDGWMPDARSGNSNGRTQGGSNSDVVVADAFVKGVRGIDYETALEAMVKNATVDPPDAEKEGRGGLPDYLGKGYISTDYPRAGSRTVEYAYDDFAIAQVACGLGKREVAAKYIRQSGNFANLWDRELEVNGIKGFLRPRQPDGSWAEPYLTRRGTWPDFFYEADLWTYSVYAPHDMARLIEMAGGRDAFQRRLDVTFDRLLFDMTNEPGFLMPMLYHWLGRPDKSARRIIDYRTKGFLDERGGTPGPEDSGAMSSWLAFHSMGFFPVAGQDLYLIGTPVFTRSVLDLGNGGRLVIEAPGADDPANRYVQRAEINGQSIDRAWFRHSEIAKGGRLVLHMGPEPTTFGTRELPPSLSTDAHLRCEG